jgi:hypothetical protein
MVLTAYFVISPVIGLSCHRRQRNSFHQLDASVEASGPHDFAVRKKGALVSSAPRVHRILHPPFVTIAKRPSIGSERKRYRSDLGRKGIGIFLRAGLDR